MKVDPSANVEEIQTKITMLLSMPFSYDALSLKADPENISILPVGGYSVYSMPQSSHLHMSLLNLVNYWINNTLTKHYLFLYV